MSRWDATEVHLREESDMTQLCSPHPLLRKFLITDTVSYDDFMVVAMISY